MTLPAMIAAKKPVATYSYLDAQGRLVFYVARFEKDGKKEFRPYRPTEVSEFYLEKAPPGPWPLYNLPRLAEHTGPVVVVEGEKACDAFNRQTKKYLAVTWPFGASSVKKAHWEPLFGREVILWPDADVAGEKAMDALYDVLKGHCQLSRLNVSRCAPGFDAADFSGDNIDEFLEHQLAPCPAPKADKPKTFDDFLALWEKLGLQIRYRTDRQGILKSASPINSAANVAKVLTRHEIWAHRLWYDTFSYQTCVDWPPGLEWSNPNYDTLHMLRVFQDFYGFEDIHAQVVEQGLTLAAIGNQRNSAQEWLNALKWDGKARVNNFFHVYFGAEDNDYVTAVSRNFLISLVARICSPGCKVDTMVILEGEQGKKKSSTLELLVGKDWFTEVRDSLSGKDFLITLQGKVLVEFSEMDAFEKAEVSTIKRIVSCKTDRYRDVFGKKATDHHRQCVFVGTTNERQYLRDTTGNRRFWPIECQTIEPELLALDREQLFAEALVLYQAGASWWEMPGDAETVQESRRERDPWEAALERFFKRERIKGRLQFETHEIASDGLGIPIGHLGVRESRRIGRCLRALGYELKAHRRRLDSGESEVFRAWRRVNDLEMVSNGIG